MRTKQEIFAVIVEHVYAVLPDLRGRELQPTESLRELGANSMDRAEIVMAVIDDLELNLPRGELARPTNLGELTDLLHAKSG